MPSLKSDQLTGSAYWHSLDELADTPEFRQFVAREFPNRASEWLDGNRRHFLKIMAASFALAGLAGCRRWPEEQLAPYAHRPANRDPGTPIHYNTGMELGGYGQGMRITSVDGRPIKVDGNPDHPFNKGGSDIYGQASVLNVYDPDRSRSVLKKPAAGEAVVSTWAEFAAFWRSHASGLADGQLEAARHESEQRRGLMRSATFLEQASLRELVVKWRVPVPGWDGTPVSAWRVAGLTISGYALRAKTHPFRDWLRAFVLFSETQKDHASWNHFWLHEVEEKRMPRFWISWAFEHLMAFRKVTNGTPCDIQLSTYLVGSDLVVSADKGFISSSRRCHSEAPFNIAQAHLIPAGRQGVEALLNYLREFSSGRPAV